MIYLCGGNSVPAKLKELPGAKFVSKTNKLWYHPSLVALISFGGFNETSVTARFQAVLHFLSCV
jgi:hypothetical protein